MWPMQTIEIFAPAPAAKALPCARTRNDGRLERFPEPMRTRARALAARDPRLADLAGSFPALLAALAVPRARFDAAPVIARVIDGAPLSALAKAADVPLWTRGLGPEAFDGPLPALPNSAEFSRRIANHFPRARKWAPKWLSLVADAAQCADDEVALWFAREIADGVKNPKRRRYGKPRKQSWRHIFLWAWHSRRPSTIGHAFLDTVWSPGIGLKNAKAAATDWRSGLDLHLYLGERRIADRWLTLRQKNGYQFVPLCTPQEILSEARAMKNCLRGYGASIAEGWSRVWSVRKNGERLATIELLASEESRLPHISQIRVANDKDTTDEIRTIVRRWFLSHEFGGINTEKDGYIGMDRKAWTSLWRPYWLEKRRIPAWLPLAPDPVIYYAL